MSSDSSSRCQRTLVSTKLIGTLGDRRAAEVFARHDKLARDLLPAFGLEIDRTDGFLFLFDRPAVAVDYALEYQRRLQKLSRDLGVPLDARVGIHIGEVRLRRNPRAYVARGAKPIEIEGLAKPTVARLTSLARGSQILLTKAAFDLARRATVGNETASPVVRWVAHGKYAVKGVDEPVEVFEVGIDGQTAFAPPPDSEKAERIAGPSAGRRAAVLSAAGIAIAALTVPATLLFRSRDGDVPRPIASRRLTSAPGWEAEPVISPDGTLVAYSSDEKDRGDIWIVDARGSSTLRLTDDPAEDRSPAWFPDGNTIAFASDRSGRWGIWKVPRLGGSATAIVENALDPAVSPDGKSIAFARPSSSSSKSFTIWVAPLDDPGKAEMLTTEQDGFFEHRHPAWRPDGAALAFQDWEDVWLVSSKGGRPQSLTKTGWSGWPAWSGDGKNVYFFSGRDNTTALWRVPGEGGQAVRVTMGTGPEVQPHVMRDGSRLAYSTYAAINRLVFVDLTTRALVEAPVTGDECEVAISPDANRIAFYSERRGSTGLWVQQLDRLRPTGEPRKITDRAVARPAFSPDGRWIAFQANSAGQRDIWIAPADGGLSQRFTDTDDASEMHPAWSPDGTRLAFASSVGGAMQIWTAPFTDGRRTGDPRQLTSSSTSNSLPAWSPDNEHVAFIGRTEGDDAEVFVTHVRGGDPRPVTSGAQAVMVHWESPAGLLVSGTWGGQSPTLRRVALENAKSLPMTPEVRFGNVGLGGFDVSLDGHVLLALAQEARGDVWLLEAKPGAY